ncbi:MAG: hypothetical protein M1814_004366 [Vezdaea aestivalis]|nr:MAG: hypothetical protein M1814_004366 [Vezdaea aestivalis]
MAQGSQKLKSVPKGSRPSKITKPSKGRRSIKTKNQKRMTQDKKAVELQKRLIKGTERMLYEKVGRLEMVCGGKKGGAASSGPSKKKK